MGTKKRRRNFDREFKLVAVWLIANGGYKISEVEENLAVIICTFKIVSFIRFNLDMRLISTYINTTFLQLLLDKIAIIVLLLSLRNRMLTVFNSLKYNSIVSFRH